MTDYHERLVSGAFAAKKPAAAKGPVEKIPDEADKPAEAEQAPSKRKGRQSG